jgi:hypothetical protein
VAVASRKQVAVPGNGTDIVPPTTDPDVTPDAARVALADTVARHKAATERLAGLEQAQDDLLQRRLDARRRIRDAEEAVTRLDAAERARRVDAMLCGGSHAPSPELAAAKQELTDAHAAAAEIADASDILNDSVEPARREADAAGYAVKRAIGAVLADSDAVSRLLDYHSQLWREVHGITHALRYVDSRFGIPPEHRNWFATPPLEEFFDPAPLELWRAAIARLEAGDMTVRLPGEDNDNARGRAS